MQKIIISLLKGILRIIWKAFLMVLWGCLRIAEIILQQINKLLKNLIS